MPPQNYRRSRNGCVTCRTARIKCDEAHPLCKQCERRGVQCGGYKVKLKWVEISDISPDTHAPAKSVVKPRSSLAICPSSSSSSSFKTRRVAQSCKKAGPSVAVTYSPSTGPQLHSSSDVFIFTHWAQSLPEVVYPNPKEYVNMRDPYLSFVWRQDSILLPAVLAAGASHLYALGVVTQAELLERKQRALGKMVAAVQQQRKHPASRQSADAVPLYLMEEAIAATMALIGLEIMQGSDTAAIRPLIRGARAQLEEKRRLLEGMSESRQLDRPTPMLSVNIKMMAYMDAVCCVPCARKPILDPPFWQDVVLPHCTNASKDDPDIVFGYTTDILRIIGESATLVDDYFGGATTPDAFVLSRYVLVQKLVECCRDLPPATQQPFSQDGPVDTPESSRIRTSNACIAAALAHGLATQIFLLRADHEDARTNWTTERSSKDIVALADELAEAVSAVPVDTYASTIMIWPTFVLGCESMAVSSRRHQVERLFERMFAKHGLLNISVCLELLKSRIWKIGDIRKTAGPDEGSKSPEVEDPCPYSQGHWVRLCWEEKLEVCTA